MSYICKGKFEGKHHKDRKHSKVKYHCHYTGECRGAAHSIYSVPKEISKVFQNRSNSDYHFITKNLAEKLEGQVTFLGENNDTYITFTV